MRVTGETLSRSRRTLGYLLRQAYEHLAEHVYGQMAEAGFSDIRRAHSAVFRHIGASARG